MTPLLPYIRCLLILIHHSLVFGHHPILPLSHLQNLRSFTYSDIRVEDDPFPFQVLQSIPASLKHLNISIRDDDEMWEEDLEWYFEDLRWVLRLEQFAELEKLEVWLLTELRSRGGFSRTGRNLGYWRLSMVSTESYRSFIEL